MKASSYQISALFHDFGRLERIDQISEKHTHFISRFGSLLMFRAWLFVACT
ncbi:hypothetical protein V6Z11_A07G071100 [Gossypium hirsutum]